MQLVPIGYVHSPYKQKFAIPRQPSLVPQALGKIVFEPAFSDPNVLRGLEDFARLWLIFGFHATADEGWSPTVTPPRLGGTTRIGVFATRSTYRPNPLGLSVVEFAGIEQRANTLILNVKGIDLLDGTPVYDIKPYVPYADAWPEAAAAYADSAPHADLPVSFTPLAQQDLQAVAGTHPTLADFIVAVLQQDPRPAQHIRQQSEREFGMYLDDFNVRWQVRAGHCEVLRVSARDLPLPADKGFPHAPG